MADIKKNCKVPKKINLKSGEKLHENHKELHNNSYEPGSSQKKCKSLLLGFKLRCP